MVYLHGLVTLSFYLSITCQYFGAVHFVLSRPIDFFHLTSVLLSVTLSLSTFFFTSPFLICLPVVYFFFYPRYT